MESWNEKLFANVFLIKKNIFKFMTKTKKFEARRERGRERRNGERCNINWTTAITSPSWVWYIKQSSGVWLEEKQTPSNSVEIDGAKLPDN